LEVHEPASKVVADANVVEPRPRAADEVAGKSIGVIVNPEVPTDGDENLEPIAIVNVVEPATPPGTGWLERTNVN